MSVVINGSEPFDVMIASNIVNCQTANIKFKNISFQCETIEDADGTVFVKMSSAQPDVADINAGDTIYRQAVFNVLREECSTAVEDFLRDKIKAIPPAQPEIVKCNSCKHWKQITGKMRGFGVGKCYLNSAKLVADNGFCCWAERREE